MAISLGDYLAWLRESTSAPTMGRRPSAKRESGQDTSTNSPGETGTQAASDDTSLGGRMSLAAALGPLTLQNTIAPPTNLAQATLSLMGLLAGPIGGVIGKAAVAGMKAHNQAVIGRIAIPEEFTPEPTVENNPAIGANLGTYSGFAPGTALSQSTAPPGTRGSQITLGPKGEITYNGPRVGQPVEGATPDAGVAAAAAAAAAAAGVAGNTGVGLGEGPAGESGGTTGGSTGGNYRGGGQVRDISRRAGGAEPITAHQGEFVVSLGPSKKYRKLLEAINADAPAKITKQARTLTGATRRLVSTALHVRTHGRRLRDLLLTALLLPPTHGWRALTPTAGRYEVWLGPSPWGLRVIAGGASASDNFNRANETPLGGNWSGGPATINLASNAITGAASDTFGRYTAVGFTADQDVSLDWASGSAGDGGPAARVPAGGSLDGYFLTFASNPPICKYVAGSFTAIGGTQATPSVGNTYRLTVVGTSLSAYLAGVAKGSVTDSAISAAGAPGVFMFNTGDTWDNWSAADIVAAGGQAARAMHYARLHRR